MTILQKVEHEGSAWRFMLSLGLYFIDNFKIPTKEKTNYWNGKLVTIEAFSKSVYDLEYRL